MAPEAEREVIEDASFMEGEMKTGLLWFDDNPNVPLATKIEKAARRYRERLGARPNVCYVHPQTLAGAEVMPAQVKVVESRSIQPNYFWIGRRSR